MRAPHLALSLLLLIAPVWAQSTSAVSPQASPTQSSEKKAEKEHAPALNRNGDEPPTESAKAEQAPAEARETTTLQNTPSTVAHEAEPASLTNDQIKELIRKSADHDIQNDLKQRDYTYVQRAEMHFLDGDGKVKKNESETSEVMILYGEQVERKIAKDDKPLSEKDAAKEEKKIRELIEKRKNESDEQRQKRLAKQARDREDGRKFVQEIADAFDFTYRGTEIVGGRNTYVIDCEPRARYEPHLKEAKYLKKFRGRVWIEPTEFQFVKMDAEAIDNISWGLFLARIHKGAHLVVEQTRVNDEVWLPKHVQVRFDGKLALLKTLRMDIDVAYKDYKKFGSSSRIVGFEALSTRPDSQPK